MSNPAALAHAGVLLHLAWSTVPYSAEQTPGREQTHDLPLLVARTQVGKSVKVKVLRDKSTETYDVKIEELKEEEVAEAGTTATEDLGLTVQTLTPELAETLGLERTIQHIVNESALSRA